MRKEEISWRVVVWWEGAAARAGTADRALMFEVWGLNTLRSIEHDGDLALIVSLSYSGDADVAVWYTAHRITPQPLPPGPPPHHHHPTSTTVIKRFSFEKRFVHTVSTRYRFDHISALFFVDNGIKVSEQSWTILPVRLTALSLGRSFESWALIRWSDWLLFHAPSRRE